MMRAIISVLLTLVSAAYHVAATNGKGMTWVRYANSGYSGTTAVVKVGCQDGSFACNPYQGDTSCNNFLPILCINKVGFATPTNLQTGFYAQWSGGLIAITPQVLGLTLTSLSVANSICKKYFNANWEMAEFHGTAGSNGGWAWYAYGGIPLGTRFWTYINDQPGNCWNP